MMLPAHRSVVVAIEGLDGVGKTTTARALYRSLRHKQVPVVLRHYETAYLPNTYRRLRETQDPHVRFFFEMCSLALLRRELLTSLRGYICICDRYYSSAVASYEIAIGAVNSLQPLSTFLPSPDLNILLVCDPETRRIRLESRQPPASPRKLESLGPLGERVLNTIRTHADWYTVRSDTYSVHECVLAIEEALLG